MSDLKEVGRKLCALCAEGKYDEAMATLYAPDAVQAEAFAMPGMERETKGLEAIGKAAAEWAASTEIHSATTSKPFFFPPDRFALHHGDRLLAQGRADAGSPPDEGNLRVHRQGRQDRAGRVLLRHARGVLTIAAGRTVAAGGRAIGV
jgi:hypothetical protein